MTFTEAYKACRSSHVVYKDGVPHTITYTTGGGYVMPREGIAVIKPLNGTREDEREVSVHEITATKKLDKAMVAENYEAVLAYAQEHGQELSEEETIERTSNWAGVPKTIAAEVIAECQASKPSA